MTTFSECWGWLKRTAWPWLKLRWRWVLAGLGALVAMALVARRRSVQDVPSLEADRRDIDRDAAEQLEDLREEAEVKRVDVLERHAEELEVIQVEMNDRYEEVRNDPEALQEWLLDTGRKQRKL